jgi:hypothetical protein
MSFQVSRQTCARLPIARPVGFRSRDKADIKRLQLVLVETPLVTLLWGYYMKSALRRILSDSARLDVPGDSLADGADLYDADLYAAGLSSRATVHLMLAVEDGLDAKAWPADVREFLWGDTQSHISARLEALS